MKFVPAPRSGHGAVRLNIRDGASGRVVEIARSAPGERFKVEIQDLLGQPLWLFPTVQVDGSGVALLDIRVVPPGQGHRVYVTNLRTGEKLSTAC